MTSYADVGRASAMLVELSSISTAITNLDNGGEIVSMDVSAGPPETGGFSGSTAKVATEYMHPPPQMITALKVLLEERRVAIIAELDSMGITPEGQPSVKRTTRR